MEAATLLTWLAVFSTGQAKLQHCSQRFGPRSGTRLLHVWFGVSLDDRPWQ